MASVVSTESSRLTQQQRLDQMKSQRERNKLGQFATPPQLSLEIAKYAWKRLGRRKGAFRFIDPAVGTGSFFSATMQVFPKGKISHATGIELDHGLARTARELWSDYGLEIIEGDFTKQAPPEEACRYDLLLTNPPYVRHHHLHADEKARLRQSLLTHLDLQISGLAGLYCYFLLLSHLWLADRALAIWLIPSEFMDVNYGQAIKRYLTERVSLLHIHRFCPSDIQFSDVLVSSAIVAFRNVRPKKGQQVTFSFGGSLGKPKSVQTVELGELRHLRKWTSLPQRNGNGHGRVSTTLGDLFEIKRGLATGKNSFFIVTRQRAEELGIPSVFLRPIVPSPRYLRETIIEGDGEGYPELKPQLVLIDCPLGEDEVQVRYPNFWVYLEKGKAEGVHEGYLTSRRSPWYSQEPRAVAPFLCTYMGRSMKRPFRFIRNKSRATAANVYLLLYPKAELKGKLAERPELSETVFEALRDIGPEDFLSEARVYGGGLHKMEPGELKRLPADAIARALRLKTQRTFGF